VYHDSLVGEIRAAKGQELVEIRTPGSERWLKIGEAIGGVATESIQQQMIRRTIKEHLDKELRLNPMGIKVLSLFFIDHVDKYRQQVPDGVPIKGDYAKLFEAEYRRAIKLPEYAALLKDQNPDLLAAEVHEGYFSIDKKGAWSDTQENNQSNRDNAERAYNLIMKDKERLLGFETPLKFIFSHSALREGWDNPNVFQICALRDMSSERERRQTIGRGLRLCVNQQGERIRGFEVNTLTVVAMESYQDFAENLQKEIGRTRAFGWPGGASFAGIPVVDEHGQARAWSTPRPSGITSRARASGRQGEVPHQGRQPGPAGGVCQTPAPCGGGPAEGGGKLDIKNADERRPSRPARPPPERGVQGPVGSDCTRPHTGALTTRH
jgi:type III restriction enzyme